MGKLVVINLFVGDFEQDVTISLEIWTESDRKWIAKATGKLPPAKEILENYKSWQLKYRQHISGRNSVRLSASGGTNTTIIYDIKQASKQLEANLNNWLRAEYAFSPIREKLFQNLKDNAEEIRVIFDIDNPELELLPWHLWDDFFNHYHRAEVALSLPVHNNQIAITTNSQVKVLSVFGRDTSINLHKDWEMLERKLAKQSNATLIHLKKPTLDNLCEQIEEHQPQILFFAGHSRSEESGNNGYIDLNDEESITIEDLEPELRKAVKWGLQLTIFNSCDGLGIARQLAKLDVPNIIVMREPVPDEVAQKFLQRFLEAFSQGKPLHLAVRRARERINRLERKYPGATWLPMTFQNPANPPLTWRSLGGVEISNSSEGSTVTNPDLSKENNSEISWLETHIPELRQLTIICKNGHRNLNNNRFCTHCGVALTNLLFCSKGHGNACVNKFCSFCGESLQPLSNILSQKRLIPPPTVGCPPEVSNPESVSTQLQVTSSGKKGYEENNQTTSNSSLLNVGDILTGRYKIQKILGQGGFSKTFIAEDINLPNNPLCVVKQLKPVDTNPSVMEIARRLFATEAQIQHKLGYHDQIPRLLAYFEENQGFYLVQQYIEGHDLEQELISGERLRENQVIAILQDVLNVLEFVHNNNVIHRDIKPSNLIRRKEDQKLVLIDFGAVKQISEVSVPSTNMTIAIGTRGYMPPEQALGKPSFSSDIYSLGLICIQALTGIPAQTLTTDMQTGEITWRENANVSDEIAAILTKMVHTDFIERYQSVTEVTKALSDINRIITINPCTPKPETNIKTETNIFSRMKSFFKRR